MQGSFDSNVASVPALTVTTTDGATGVQAKVEKGMALFGESNDFGVVGSSTGGAAITGNATGHAIGVRADAQSGNGLNAQSVDAIAILGTSDTNVGVQGVCQGGYNFGVVGISPNCGVAAFNPNNANAAYLAGPSNAAWLNGEVYVSERLWKAGGGFRIDHPGDPENRYLSHSFVESPEMKNIYDGVVTTDAEGTGIVVLPDWFELLNRDVRYQLCPIGKPAPNLHVAEVVKDGQFKIAGAPPDTAISWQVTGVRKDRWAQANSIQVEEQKQESERGFYLHPHLHGQSEESSMGLKRHKPRLAP